MEPEETRGLPHICQPETRDQEVPHAGEDVIRCKLAQLG
jgi:hypothetical protein